MGKSYSSTNQEDNRLYVEGGGVGLAPGSNLSIQDYFSDNVSDAMKEVLALAGTVGGYSLGTVEKAIQSVENVNAVLGEQLHRTEVGSADILPKMVMYIAIAVVAYSVLKKVF